MLIKNVLKGIRKHPFRILGILLMVIVAEILYVTLSITVIDAKDSLSHYRVDYNQEDFSFDMYYLLDPTEQQILDLTGHYATTPTTIYELTDVDYEMVIESRIDAIETQYPVTIESRVYKQITEYSDQLKKNVTFRAIRMNDGIDKTYLKAGRLPIGPDELALTNTFANANHLKLGDSYTFHGHTYTLVGFVYFVDYIYPQLASDSLIFDSSTQSLVALSNDAFDSLSISPVTYYVGTFNSPMSTKDMTSFYMIQLVDNKNNMRTGAIQSEIEMDGKIVGVLSGALVILAVVMIGIVVNKSIQFERAQIGVIKSLGYKNREIVRAYMFYPLIVSLLGPFIGYSLGILLSHPLIQVFDLYYQMPLSNIPFDWGLISAAILFPFLSLNLFSVWIIYLLVKKAPLDLIKPTVDEKTSRVVSRLSPFLAHLKFKTRFKYTIALRTWGKMAIAFLGVFIASVYLVFALSGMNSFNSILNDSFRNADYDYQILLDQPTMATPQVSGDSFMMMPSVITTATKDVDVTLMGIDETLSLYSLENKAGDHLLPDLYQNSQNVVISSMLEYTENLKIGDSLSLKINRSSGISETMTYHVVGIVENYTLPLIFMQKAAVNQILGLDPTYYNGLWSHEKATDHVLSIYAKADLMQSVESMMSSAKSMIDIMILASIALAMIVLIMIAHFTMDDHFKTISFLKVMGYTRKEIRGMILNIYLPIVILGYLVAIPVTLLSLKALMRLISQELHFAIPFDMTVLQMGIGFLVIVATYFISLWVSARKLKKISLQEVLKYDE